MPTTAQLRYEVLDALARRERLDALRQALERSREMECWLAGGVVRDVLLGERPNDVDLFVNGPQIADFLADLAREGDLHSGPFGSPRWRPDIAGGYVDIIPIPAFRNGLWECADMTDVLNQFDFTCNAVAVSLRSEAVLDPQNGCRDARSGTLRAVRFDYPDEPIAAGSPLSRPAVLWFRLLHYAAHKRLEIEPVTRRWLRDHAHHRAALDDFETTFFDLHPDALALLGDHA